MSTAHRPTWDPAQAREVKGGSRQYSVRDMAAHTKLKFRQAGQTSVNEVKRSDLRAELIAAEAEARAKKRKAAGLPIEDEQPVVAAIEGEEANKRRKLLQEALELDKDSDSDEDEAEDGAKDGAKGGDVNGNQNGAGKSGGGDGDGGADNDEDGDDEDDEDDDDDTAELFRELEKIKRERAAEKARVDEVEAAATEAEREARIASANPLLNLAAALGTAPGVNTTAPGTFAVKRRWDDDLIFKNQATSDKDKLPGQFVNDLLRTEFHKKFMSRFIK